MSKIDQCEIEALALLGVQPGTQILKSSMSPSSEQVSKQFTWISPIVLLGNYEVFDFSKGYDPGRKLRYSYGWGRYDEDRVGMYEAELFKKAENSRTVHMGVDLGAPAGTPVFSPVRARFWGADYRGELGDYGGTLIFQSEDSRWPYYFLFGHLSRCSLELSKKKNLVEAGELIGWVGEKNENGGWNPHLHLQLSLFEPQLVDLPGAVSAKLRESAKKIFPDPSGFLREALAGWDTTFSC